MIFIALRELGPQAVFQFGLYRLGLISGVVRQLTRSPRFSAETQTVSAPAAIYTPPCREELLAILGSGGVQAALAEAELAVNGKTRLFGGDAVEICLQPPQPLRHWTDYELGRASVDVDVKLVWEPARLGWAVGLARGYLLSGDERYAAAFWGLLEEFWDANPPYLGLNWVSAQEAGIRLMALNAAWGVFGRSPHSTAPRAARLAQSIGVHAARIPPTLVYARAQNNNHLLSEAAGLYTAGLAIPSHPQARRWRSTGWQWLQRGFTAQIDANGVYIQHSANYQRLMLQIALWAQRIALEAGMAFPALSLERLAASTAFLIELLDRQSGGVPNLGPNDGAYLFPFSNLPYEDFRPVLQAASQVFCGKKLLDAGPWDEITAWLGGRADPASPPAAVAEPVMDQPCVRTEVAEQKPPHTLRSPGGDSWAYLRAARFNGRPGHADQLHLDLWWCGMNVAQDAGTYLYNAPDPWGNGLMGSDVHNTVTVDGLDQMLRAGRFLFLERADAEVSPEGLERGENWTRLSAEHRGYARFGVIHRRTVTALAPETWLVEDALLPSSTAPAGELEHRACLSWLTQDWNWEVMEREEDAPGGEFASGFKLRFSSPAGPIQLLLGASQHAGALLPLELQLVRAGELLYGSGPVKPTWGWSSPTYGVKRPALAVKLHLRGRLPLYFYSEWRLGEISGAP
ncbi:MAG: alginate lyase family protein [Anaerolineae bacterium]|nr:alginate lyase family protein [Anaerolineae bacterium]MCZ7552029.1 heparinase II/III family protein [Anaerolineales bacterium]